MKTKPKRRISGILILGGVLFIAAALALTLYNFWDDFRARSEVNSALDKVFLIQQSSDDDADQSDLPDYIQNPEMEMPTAQINGHDYIGTLKIPAINIELPVLKELDYTNLKIAPCHYMGSVYLNNMIIAGHNYTSHLGPIGNLRPGDEVFFTDMANHEFCYEVVELETLERTAVEEMQSGGWDLTLFTCTLSGTARVTVRCERIDSDL